jgi:hypothetical protein
VSRRPSGRPPRGRGGRARRAGCGGGGSGDGVAAAFVAIIFAVFSVVFLAAPRAPRAQPSANPSPAETEPDPPLDVTVVGRLVDFQWARALVGPRGPGGLPSRWTRADRFEPLDILGGAGAGRPGTLRCWLDLSDPRRARVYFAAQASERFLIRDVELSGRFDELDREALAEVLELSLAALLENQRAGLTRDETEALLAKRSRPSPSSGKAAAPTPAPVAPVPSPRSATGARAWPGSGALEVFYAAQARGRALPVAQGPGLLASWGRSAALREVLWLSGQVQLPATARRDQIGLETETVALRAGLGVTWPTGRRAFSARLGAGADLDHLTPRPGTGDASAALTSARWSSSLVGTAALGADARLGRRVSVGARAFVDVWPTQVHYDLQLDGVVTPIFSPWRVRPGLALDLTFP